MRESREFQCSVTYITKHVDKRVVGAVGHRKPVTAEKDDVDVGIP